MIFTCGWQVTAQQQRHEQWSAITSYYTWDTQCSLGNALLAAILLHLLTCVRLTPAANSKTHHCPRAQPRTQHDNETPADGSTGSTVGAHLDTQHTLAEHDVAHCCVNVHACGVAGRHHVTVLELHALGTLGTQLAGNNDLRKQNINQVLGT